MTNLSVIILNYNAGPFLKKCLESVARCLRLGSSEIKTGIIIVDNASSDGSRKYLKSLESRGLGSSNKKKINPNSKLPNPIPLTVIFNDKNLGFSGGNNAGLKHISEDTDYVLFLNPDTVVKPGVFNKTVKFLETHPRAGAVTCRLELANGQLDEACHRGFPTPWRALTYFLGLEKLFPHSKLFAGYTLGHKLKKDKPHQIDACSGAFLLIRKDLGEKLNWWDEDYFFYGEDIDFCYRIKQAGSEVWFLPNVSITHYRGVTSGVKKHSQKMTKAKKKTKLKAVKASTEAMRIFYNKHYLDKYPFVLSQLVLLGIKMLENVRKLKIKLGMGF